MDARARERMRMPPVPEPLPVVIERHGFDPAEIDIVINSHLHWDHCSGNTILTADGVVPAFPNARYFASRGEWALGEQFPVAVAEREHVRVPAA
jgi:glyoxylase-like metal-dependent hydrolase (beta-lactamase superfamily II)